jgi:hypothetical protein
MRIAAILSAGLALALTGVTAVWAQERIPFRPDEAVLACQARAAHEIARRHGIVPMPTARFKAQRQPDGWIVRGAYLAPRQGTGQPIQVACDVSADGVRLAVTGGE